jgi:hypothetical protein
MAKTISNINKPTTGKPSQVTEQTDQDKSANYPVSVYLKRHEREYMEALAERLGVSDHSLRQFAIQYFIDQHRAGNVEIPTETKTVTEISST